MATNKNEKLSNLTVEEKLQHLYELQRMDTEIDKIRTLRGELPLEVEDLEDEVEGLQTRIEKLENDVINIEKGISDKKTSIANSEELIKKYSSQLENVRNSREYDALSKEVEYQKLDIELQNKKIKEDLVSKNEKTVNLDASKLKYEECKKDLIAKKGELSDIISETHKDEERLIEKSKKLEADIDERLLNAYKRIRDNAKNGLAVAVIDRDACGGCFNKIPPQRQLDINSHKKIIVCEYCGRILVDKYICDYDGKIRAKDEKALLETPKRKGRRKKI